MLKLFQDILITLNDRSFLLFIFAKITKHVNTINNGFPFKNISIHLDNGNFTLNTLIKCNKYKYHYFLINIYQNKTLVFTNRTHH